MTGTHSFGLPPFAAILPDGRRRHFQHGPIDLVIEAFGPADEVEAAYAQAWQRFQGVLGELVGELPLLRRPLGARDPALEGPVAWRMLAACRPHRGSYVTPMAAVAGAVADAVLAAMIEDRRLDRAYVNNGGDIALHLAPGESFTTGIVTLGALPVLDGLSGIAAADPVRGIATSGWRGRSFSLGIADSVTVLARSAAAADVTATLIANAVDVEDPAIDRAPASDLDPDSDLGGQRVTTGVGPLAPDKVARALEAGAALAEELRRRGLIAGALLTLQGRSRILVRNVSLAA